MYKIGVIGRRDAILCYMAAGFEIYGADSPEDAAKRVSQAKDEGCRIIFITDEFAEGISDPAVIPLPEKNGRYGYKRMSEATVKAIGSDIIYKEKR
jgi:V/A-type H+-transporting ATPase subunit F